MAVGDWDRRELCPDGGCTGLIGPEGTCKVCGRAAPNWGDERKRGTQDLQDDEEDAADDDPIKPATPVAIGGGEWNTRALCPDGACVGLIGSDGKCKVCGTAANPSDFIASAPDDDDDDEYVDDEYEDDDDELAAAADELAGIAPPAEVATATAMAEGADEDDRKLCPDGACVGLIGADGKCKVCGKEAAA
jgi:hypothetical protein